MTDVWQTVEFAGVLSGALSGALAGLLDVAAACVAIELPVSGPTDLDVGSFEDAMTVKGLFNYLIRKPLFWAAFIASLFFAAILVQVFQQMRHDSDQHVPTFRRAARSLGIDVSNQRLLEDIAKSVGHDNPASLLISIGCFDAAVAKYPRAKSNAKAIAQIRSRVFT